MPVAHDFNHGADYSVGLSARAFVALVDLESYPAWVSEKADRLDLLQHLCHEMEVLTATMWEVPEGRVGLQFHWQKDDPARASLASDMPLASGNIRTSGRLGLVADEALLAAARKLCGDPADHDGVHQLLVPPGIYAVTVRNFAESLNSLGQVSYAVTLNHHPHPPPRLQPVRLGGRARPLADYLIADSDTPKEAASHKMPR